MNFFMRIGRKIEKREDVYKKKKKAGQRRREEMQIFQRIQDRKGI